MTSHLLSFGETEVYVESLKCCPIESIGSLPWFSDHKRLEHLRQQSVIEATHNVEERVKDSVITYNKFSVLLYEVLSIQLWREKVWKKILKRQDKEIQNGFFAYMILYHECTAVNFIQIIIHHKDTVACLNEAALDLIDYCAYQLISISSEKMQEELDESSEAGRLQNQQREMALNIGLACIAILAALSEHLHELSISAVSRLYETHDIPLLLSSLLHVQPWRRRSDHHTWQYHCEGRWVSWDPEELCKSEAQCWIGLRGLLLHPAAGQHYEMTEYRKQSLMKLQKFLHERVIDQMSPLLELKQYLAQVSMAGQVKPNRTPLIIEAVASIRDSLAAQSAKWKTLAQLHMAIIFNEGDHKKEIMEIAKSVSDTYDDFDMTMPQEEKQESKQRCESCGSRAFKRCSQCRAIWYCQRKCQVTHWKIHKDQCTAPKST